MEKQTDGLSQKNKGNRKSKQKLLFILNTTENKDQRVNGEKLSEEGALFNTGNN